MTPIKGSLYLDDEKGISYRMVDTWFRAVNKGKPTYVFQPQYPSGGGNLSIELKAEVPADWRLVWSPE